MRISKKIFKQRIRHILVDEYQDTNIVQHELLKQWRLERRKKQEILLSIHCARWAMRINRFIHGAAQRLANIMNFTKDFPGTHHH